MLRVAHFVERYPLKEQGYIFDQIVTSTSRHDRVVTAQLLPNRLSKSLGHDVTALFTLPTRIGTHRLFGRIYNRLTETSVAGSYYAHVSKRLQRELRARPADIVHAHFGTAAAKLAGFRRSAGTPLVTTFYGVDASACLRDPKWLERYKRLFAVGNLFIVLSDTVIDRLVAAGCAREKISVWNIGIDFSSFPYRPRSFDAKAIKLLCVARFVEKKGHGILLDAFRQLVNSHPAALTLIGYGPLLPQISSTVAKYELQNAVHIIDTSKRSDFVELFPHALYEHDVFVLPSIAARDGDDEAGPALTIVCAQASGMPVLTTAHPGSERSIIDGTTGLFCNPSASSLANKISEVIGNTGLAEAIGRSGSELVQREFSLPSQLRKLEDFYVRVIDSRKTAESEVFTGS